MVPVSGSSAWDIWQREWQDMEFSQNIVPALPVIILPVLGDE
jgi:hypothetical protein